MSRCGNCMLSLHAHHKRQSAPPCCPKGGVYREATEEELEAGYREAFPDGMPGPIATFHKDSPEDVERFKSIFGPDALRKTFGPGGRGMAEIHEKLTGGAA